jgi:hypothetical protein
MNSWSSRILSPAVVVFTVFTICAAILIATAIGSLRAPHPSTWAPIAFAFAWAVMSMVVSGTYAIATGRRAGRSYVSRKGATTVGADPLGLNRTGFELHGPGAEMAAAEDVAVTSKVPAILLALSSIALVTFLLWLWRSGQATGYGTLVSQLLPFYMLNWTRNAWPRADREPQPVG